MKIIFKEKKKIKYDIGDKQLGVILTEGEPMMISLDW